jgi:hypothetical protein
MDAVPVTLVDREPGPDEETDAGTVGTRTRNRPWIPGRIPSPDAAA